MYRYLLKICFDGTDYHGWQVQPNGISVQEELQNALEKMFRYRMNVTGCSRTDAGVHANEFFCHFDLEKSIDKAGIVRGLNSILPGDIRALKCYSVDSDFHCRYDAVMKNYVYRFDTSDIQSPFVKRYALSCFGNIDIDKMNIFCKKVKGTRDFSGFSSSRRSTEDTVRTVSECYVLKKGNIIELSITANGFLYNMVRIIAGTALMIGQGIIDVNRCDEIIDSCKRSNAGKTLPPNGLFLNRVYYSGDVKNAEL